jgi:hypothetical protein
MRYIDEITKEKDADLANIRKKLSELKSGKIKEPQKKVLATVSEKREPVKEQTTPTGVSVTPKAKSEKVPIKLETKSILPQKREIKLIDFQQIKIPKKKQKLMILDDDNSDEESKFVFSPVKSEKITKLPLPDEQKIKIPKFEQNKPVVPTPTPAVKKIPKKSVKFSSTLDVKEFDPDLEIPTIVCKNIGCKDKDCKFTHPKPKILSKPLLKEKMNMPPFDSFEGVENEIMKFLVFKWKYISKDIDTMMTSLPEEYQIYIKWNYKNLLDFLSNFEDVTLKDDRFVTLSERSSTRKQKMETEEIVQQSPNAKYLNLTPELKSEGGEMKSFGNDNKLTEWHKYFASQQSKLEQIFNQHNVKMDQQIPTEKKDTMDAKKLNFGNWGKAPEKKDSGNSTENTQEEKKIETKKPNFGNWGNSPEKKTEIAKVENSGKEIRNSSENTQKTSSNMDATKYSPRKSKVSKKEYRKESDYRDEKRSSDYYTDDRRYINSSNDRSPSDYYTDDRRSSRYSRETDRRPSEYLEDRRSSEYHKEDRRSSEKRYDVFDKRISSEKTYQRIDKREKEYERSSRSGPSTPSSSLSYPYDIYSRDWNKEIEEENSLKRKSEELPFDNKRVKLESQLKNEETLEKESNPFDDLIDKIILPENVEQKTPSSTITVQIPNTKPQGDLLLDLIAMETVEVKESLKSKVPVWEGDLINLDIKIETIEIFGDSNYSEKLINEVRDLLKSHKNLTIFHIVNYKKFVSRPDDIPLGIGPLNSIPIIEASHKLHSDEKGFVYPTKEFELFLMPQNFFQKLEKNAISHCKLVAILRKL